MPQAATEPGKLPSPPHMWRVLLTDLNPGECKWPIAENRRGLALFCAAATGDRAASYCPYHQAMAWGRRP